MGLVRTLVRGFLTLCVVAGIIYLVMAVLSGLFD
jgi:hypothetical protein